MKAEQYKKIILFSYRFGAEFPNYYDKHLFSISVNSDIDFLLITDIDESILRQKYNIPLNMKILNMSQDAFIGIFKKVTGYNCQFSLSRTLPGIRPFFGLMFKDLIVDKYEYWGFHDHDMIFGNIRKFLTNDKLLKYDKFYENGHLQIIKSLDYCMYCPLMFDCINNENFEKFINNKKSGFDEMSGWNIIWDTCFNKKFYKNRPEMIDIDNWRIWSIPTNNIKAYTIIYKEKALYFTYIDKNGKCQMDEKLYLHFHGERNIKILTDNTDNYLFYNNTIIPLPYIMDNNTITKYALTKFNYNFIPYLTNEMSSQLIQMSFNADINKDQKLQNQNTSQQQICMPLNNSISINELMRHSFVITINDNQYALFNQIFKKNELLPLPKKYEGFKFTNSWCKPLIPAREIGCSASHIAIVKMAKYLDWPYVCIFEDDAYPRFNAKELIEKYINNRPNDTYILKIGSIQDPNITETIKINGLTFFKFKESVGSQAYIVFKEGYDSYIKSACYNEFLADSVLSHVDNTYVCDINMFIQYNKDRSMHFRANKYVYRKKTDSELNDILKAFPKIETYMTSISMLLAPGRLGNKFFMYARYITQSHKFNVQLLNSDNNYIKYINRLFNLNEPYCPNEQNQSAIICKEFENMRYFQSEKCFDPELIRRIFKIDSSLKRKLLEKYPILSEPNCVGIHVRRTDYITSNGIHMPLPVEYYDNAYKQYFAGCPVVCFSDDIGWCRKWIKFDNIHFIHDDEISDIISFSLCKNKICSNTAFAWWAAWLGETQDSKNIFYEYWFNPSKKLNDEEQFIQKNVIPERWIRIKSDIPYYKEPVPCNGTVFHNYYSFGTQHEHAITYKNDVFLLNHRCGSSTIRNAIDYMRGLLTAEQYHNVENKGWGLKRLTLEQTKNFISKNNPNIFMFYRDPLEYFISCANLLENWTSKSIDEYIRLVQDNLTKPPAEQQSHYSLQIMPVKLLGLQEQQVNFIHIKNIKSFFMTRYGLELAIKNVTPAPKNKKLFTLQELTDQQVNRLKHIYADDFLLNENYSRN